MVMNVLIIGAGVSALSTAHILQKNGFTVTIVASSFFRQTVSTVAGALWEMPPAVCGLYEPPPELAIAQERAWATESYHAFKYLAKNSQATGVFMRRVNFYLDRRLNDHPEEQQKYEALSNLVADLRHDGCPAIEQRNARLKQSCSSYADAYSYLAPQIDTDVYLTYLSDKFLNAGGSLLNQVITSFDQELEALCHQCKSELVINCSGLGANRLVPDADVLPVRGAWFSVMNDGSSFPRMTEAHCTSLKSSQDGAFMFVLPRGEDRLVVGGIAQANQWSKQLSRDAPEIQTMLRLCFTSFPQLKDADFANADFRVGLRPFRRGGVRLELDTASYGVPVISNYGHGGAGVLLSWGCAFSVLALARQVRSQVSRDAYSAMLESRPYTARC